MKILIIIGKKFFQVKYIRKSYRMRGIEARTHTNSTAKIIVFNTKNILLRGLKIIKVPQNIIAEATLIIKIFMYSAIKIIANKLLLYSVLNPDTSSDSPSAKSKGVRFVSASVVINHMITNGVNIISTQEY